MDGLRNLSVRASRLLEQRFGSHPEWTEDDWKLQVGDLTEQELLRIKGFGRRTLNELSEWVNGPTHRSTLKLKALGDQEKLVGRYRLGLRAQSHQHLGV